MMFTNSASRGWSVRQGKRLSSFKQIARVSGTSAFSDSHFLFGYLHSFVHVSYRII